MDTNSVSSVQGKTPAKRSKTQKKPIKVVYISNPMKVKTSASEFRALVQELTGQDAEFPPDPSRFPEPSSDDSDNSVTKNGKTLGMAQVDPNHSEGQVGSSMEWFEAFDDVDVFTPPMIDNVSALQPGGALYEFAQVDQLLRSLHAV